MDRLRCHCTQLAGLHHNPACELVGVVAVDNVVIPGTRSGLPDFLDRLRAVNGARYVAWTVDGVEDPLFLASEFGGEAGEVLNEVKKLVREARGWRGSRTTVDKLASEMGDAIISLDNLARGYGIDLAAAAAAKFNATSEANDFPHRL
jgi:NTP pyrophosphatase (non-canonical NTP hydrolase)